MTKCPSCSAVINPKWDNCLVCDSLLNEPIEYHTKEISFSPDGDAFDPDGALVSLQECARRKGISDAQVASIVDDLIRAKSLKVPWSIRIKNSPILGNYWVVSDALAKKHIPSNEVVFTAEDIKLLAEVREIFGARVVEVKKRE